jgi:hypothetical protein
MNKERRFMDIDKLNNASLRDACRGVFKVIDALQDDRPETQVAALLVCADLACKRYTVRLADVMPAVSNLMRDADYRLRPEVKGCAAYMTNEWRN